MTDRVASCSCGQLHLKVSEEPLRVSVCHCLACQRRTGGVFASQARFNASAVQVSGNSTEFTRVGDAGTKATFHFCPLCGSTVYWEIGAMPEHIAIPVGAFAEPGFPAPTFSVYEERRHAWVSMPEGIERMD